MTDTKRCSKCGETKPVSGFDRNGSSHNGLRSQCKECKRAYNHAYRQAYREELNAYDRERDKARREERRAYNRDRQALLGDPLHDRWQEITRKHATRSGRWSEAEDAYLAASTDRIVDDALALKRTHYSVVHRLRELRRRGVTLARDRALAA